ncbi:hypothetical protein FQA39_LY04433 [Lamprigera yunnana]|nr:hypothetical protein FQA39_LY04433 [Lamprigera yunnana]
MELRRSLITLSFTLALAVVVSAKGRSIETRAAIPGVVFFGKAREWITNVVGVVKNGLDNNIAFLNKTLSSFKWAVKKIYPGTLWCGDGDIASNSGELGYFKSTDDCCREHDHCNDTITSHTTKYNLINTGLFTRSHCNCDQTFYECLHRANKIVSHKIGITYFNILGPQCFKYDYPFTKCKTYNKGRCKEYGIDTTKEKIHQWFDNSKFY